MALKYKHTILIVDDEGSITKALNRIFRKEGYKILTASNGLEGIELLKKNESPVSLIISDQRMPGMTGSEFLEKSKDIFPDAMRFLLTGYSDMDAIIDAVNRGEIHRYLTKPWDDNDLLLQVRQSLEQYELILENKRLLALTGKQNKELEEVNKHLDKKVQERSKEIIEKNKELSRLNKELESSLYNTVRAFISLAEMHAPSLAGHGRRVGLLSQEIAKTLDIPENDITHIEIAALLHDTGKLGFPQKLLDYKENIWTKDDKDLFHKHPEEGQKIVQFINKLHDVGILIRHHHESYDGQGYPDQLSEESIPLGSRIIAITNAYDKITNLKVNSKSCINEYLKDRNISKDHLSEDELLQQAAIHHLKKNAFVQYDPDIVKAFLNLIKTKGIKLKREKTLLLEQLEEGMELAKSLYTSKGRFLLPYNTALTKEYINKLKEIHKHDPITQEIYILIS